MSNLLSPFLPSSFWLCRRRRRSRRWRWVRACVHGARGAGGRSEENTLVCVHKSGAFTVKMLPRNANLEKSTKPPGPPPEQVCSPIYIYPACPMHVYRASKCNRPSRTSRWSSPRRRSCTSSRPSESAVRCGEALPLVCLPRAPSLSTGLCLPGGVRIHMCVRRFLSTLCARVCSRARTRVCVCVCVCVWVDGWGRAQATEMHRVFQRDLCKLRLATARAYVKVLTDGHGPLSYTAGSSLRLHPQVQGLGPTFRLKLDIQVGAGGGGGSCLLVSRLTLLLLCNAHSPVVLTRARGVCRTRGTARYSTCR
eukprot:COSAG05_NODE_3271_length_2186_cov_459.916188_4_plen_309_part_00